MGPRDPARALLIIDELLKVAPTELPEMRLRAREARGARLSPSLDTDLETDLVEMRRTGMHGALAKGASLEASSLAPHRNRYRIKMIWCQCEGLPLHRLIHPVAVQQERKSHIASSSYDRSAEIMVEPSLSRTVGS